MAAKAGSGSAQLEQAEDRLPACAGARNASRFTGRRATSVAGRPVFPLRHSQGAAIESTTRPKPPQRRRFGAAVPEDFRAWSPSNPGGRHRPGRPQSRSPETVRDWRRSELGDDVVEEVARQAAARREARLAARRRLLGRVRISAPRKPRWLESWIGLSLPVRLSSGACAIALVAGLILFNLPLLKVQRVEVVGTSVVSRGQLLQEAGTRVGASSLLLNTQRMASNLLAQPWVASASVRVRWPGKLVISIAALPPVLIYQHGGKELVLAASGAVLGPVPQVPASASLPTVVDERAGAVAAAGAVALPANLTSALVALAKVCPAAFGVSCSQFVVSPVGALQIKSSVGWVADLGPALTPGQIGSLGPKLEALRTLAARVNLKSPTIKVIYLEDPSQVEVSP